MDKIQKYFAHGKLLITGEYTVLDGAKSIAIPTKMGQWLEVSQKKSVSQIEWTSLDHTGDVWFQCVLSSDLQEISSSDTQKCTRLIELLKTVTEINPDFKKSLIGSLVTTKLDFDRNWGLGSSSTLIHLLGQWAKINPFKLLKNSFTGSGYDIACAGAKGPIMYQLEEGCPKFREVNFKPSFSHQIHFIYLGEKQFSDREIKKYTSLNFDREVLKSKVSEISEMLLSISDSNTFCALLEEHENLLSATLHYTKVKDRFFSTIPGTFKSLGAWGGDFCLFIGEDYSLKEIEKLGFHTILKWDDLFGTTSLP